MRRILCVLAAACCVAGGARAADDDGAINFSFDQVSIPSFVKLVGDVTGFRFVVGSDVDGKVTVVAPRVRRSEVFPLFVSVLESSGFSVVEDNGLYRVVKMAERKSPAAPVIGSDEPAPAGGGIVTKVIHVRNVSAAELARVLESKVGGGASSIGAVEETNHLIVTDTAASVRQIEQMVAEIDRPGIARITDVVTLHFTGADDVAAQIHAAMGASETRGDTLRKRLPTAPGIRSETARVATVVAAPHSNQLVLIGTREQIVEMRGIVERIDVDAPVGRGRLNAVFLKYISAEEAAKNLTALLAMPADKEESGPQRGRIAVQASASNNALLVDASAGEFEVVKRLVETLDQAPKQVHISVLIAEVTASDSLDLGVEMAAVEMPGSVGDTVVQAGSLFTGGTESIMNSVQSGLFPQGITVGVGKGTSTDDDGNIVTSYPALINIKALKQNSNFRIKSETSLEAQDNREATLKIVDDIPILKSTIEGGSGTSRDVIQNIERIDVGIKLALTPRIIPGGLVQMELHPSIEAVIDEGSGVNYTPTIARREVSTTVMVPDGRTIVIAGLTREDRRKIEKRVPFLGSIPLIGWLFRSKLDSIQNTNILIFVTPRIVGDVATAQGVAAEWERKTGLSSSDE